ncbi:MAG: RraA family protein [Alphaproteobacteria bacterium]|nr:RraA family protein [Alphaproteobacteria bacterium]
MPTRTDTELLARCRRIGTSTWSDALDECGIDGVVRGLVKRGGQGRVAAFAVTATEIVGHRGQFAKSEFGVGRLVAACGPDVALLVDMGGAEVSTFGGLASLAASMRRAGAVIVDGACRDADEIAATGLWLASRHVTPTTGKTRVKLTAMGEPVTIGGIVARQGDLVVADDTGIAIVPRGEVARVLAVAERMLGMDHQIERAIRDGQSFADAAKAANYI